MLFEERQCSRVLHGPALPHGAVILNPLVLEHFGIGELLCRTRGDVDRDVEVLVVTGRRGSGRKDDG